MARGATLFGSSASLRVLRVVEAHIEAGQAGEVF
jgi:hypothetical protein